MFDTEYVVASKIVLIIKDWLNKDFGNETKEISDRMNIRMKLKFTLTYLKN